MAQHHRLVVEKLEAVERGLKRKVEMLAARWDPHIVLVEDKASGQSVIQELRTGMMHESKKTRS